MPSDAKLQATAPSLRVVFPTYLMFFPNADTLSIVARFMKDSLSFEG